MSKQNRAAGEATAYRDDYHGTWQIECGGDVMADLWRMSEETHARYPHHEGEDEGNAKHLAACWNAIEGIGGDPETVAKLRKACELFMQYDGENCQTGPTHYDDVKAAIVDALAAVKGGA